MITEEMIRTVNGIHNCMMNKLDDEVLTYINTVDAEGIAEELLNDDMLPQNKEGIMYHEMLKWFIEFCSYVEEETDIPALISDDIYDKLVAKLIDIGEEQPIGSPLSNTVIGIGERQHSFPELRGSLAKVHFIWEKDVPKNDSRKSLEGYLNNVVRQMKNAGMSIGKIPVSVDMKYDGVSHILECENGNINHILTRGDVDTNTGKDLTNTFSRFFPMFNEDPTIIDTDDLIVNMSLGKIPENVFSNDCKYGIKVETYMPTNLYNDFEKESNDKKCNRRSAVVSICNQSPENITPNIPYDKNRKMQSSYLRMQHFQIASEKEIELYDDESNYWYNIGKINNRYQYLYLKNVNEIDLSDIKASCELISTLKDEQIKLAESYMIPIDGIVITLLDEDIIKLLGRKNNKNMFQVAFKFPAGEEKTTIENVDFQVGPIAGILTPVARLKPIKINGNTISNVTVCNKAKLDRLKLHIGDEVIIHYDIIPSIFKDSTCKETNNPLIEFPTHCPICGGDVENERCINRDCPSKLIGSIMNFVNKVKIKGGLGLKTVIDFVNYGFLTSIGDIYRLYQRRDELYKLQNYGKASIDSIINGISDARDLYPHEIIGSIGIPSIGLRKMEKICRKVNIIGNLDNLDELFPLVVKIDGIGEKTALMALEGIEEKKELIEDICANTNIVGYSEPVEYEHVVCFTLVRDEEFEHYLRMHKINVKDNLTKDVKTLIVPDGIYRESTKIKQAKEKGIEIIPISEAKKRWGYE